MLAQNHWEPVVALRSLVATDPRRPLVVTANPDLLDDLVRLAGAAGVEAQVAADPAAARPYWISAPFVVIGMDQIEPCARARLPRRPSLVVVLGPGADPAGWADAGHVGAEYIAVLPAAEAWLVDRFAAGGAPPRGRVVAVLGGRGGAGASVFATGLAVTAKRRGLDVLLVDADPLGGGVDLVLGWEDLAGLRWPELIEARGPVSPLALVAALPGRGSLAVLSFDRRGLAGTPPEAMAAALDAGRRGRDLIVVDLPRRLDEAGRLALAAADRGYLVVPAELRACAAAAQIATDAVPSCPILQVVVRGPAHGGLTPDEVAQALGLPLAGVLRAEPGLARAMERGEPPAKNGRGPLAELCDRLLAEFSTPRWAAA
jgi:secretion/DNA translocation related CpaE-like protein